MYILGSICMYVRTYLFIIFKCLLLAGKHISIKQISRQDCWVTVLCTHLCILKYVVSINRYDSINVYYILWMFSEQVLAEVLL